MFLLADSIAVSVFVAFLSLTNTIRNKSKTNLCSEYLYDWCRFTPGGTSRGILVELSEGRCSSLLVQSLVHNNAPTGDVIALVCLHCIV